jgi:hypothetical protein
MRPNLGHLSDDFIFFAAKILWEKWLNKQD